MFSTIPITNLNDLFTLILSSASAFKLDQSKILSFGKELNCRDSLRFQNAEKLGVYCLSQ